MSTHATLRREAFDVAELPSDFDLAGELQQVNEQYGPTGAPCWFLYSGGTEFPGLTIGVRGTVAAVQWASRDEVLVPASGSGDRGTYFAGGRHEETFPPGSEISVADALAAVAEYARTAQRPTCIEWADLGAIRSS